MIAQQTFDVKDNRDELLVIASILDLIRLKQYQAAIECLTNRQDALLAHPKLKIYDQKEDAV